MRPLIWGLLGAGSLPQWRGWVLAGFLCLVGCAADRPPSLTATKSEAGEFKQLHGAGIENLYVLGDRVYSGSAPEGRTGFQTLERLGIKTVISVDGAAPDAELAAQYGLRYVHLPIGYGGVTVSNALQIVKAAEVMPGPVFVHCHHGKHRGPTAAALICEGLQGWSPERAEAWLRAAGTATNYPGLYRSVREFQVPSQDELWRVPNRFPSRAAVSGLVATMVQLDEHFEVLKTMQKAGFNPLQAHPDATPVNESLILTELVREAYRTRQGEERGQPFLADLAQASALAQSLHVRLRALETQPGNAARESADSAFRTLGNACVSCHQAFRD